MRLMHLSDLHIKKSYENTVFESFFQKQRHPIQRLKCFLEEAQKQQVDYILLTGDLVHEGEEEDYLLLKETLESQGIPYICVLGNHDRIEGSHCLFQSKSEEDYCLELQGYRFIAMNSASTENEKGYYSTVQLQGLSEILKTRAEKGSFILCHHPVIWTDPFFMLDQEKELKEILDGSDVRAIFCGHVHQNNVLLWKNIMQVSGDSLMCSFEIDHQKLNYVNRVGYGIIDIHENQVSVSFYQEQNT